MKIKNSNFYLSVTLVLILSVCFAVTPSQAGSAVASGSAGTVSATGQVYLHLSDESMPYVTGSGMVEIDVVGGDFQAVEGELWARYETSLTNNQISVVAAGGADQVKIVLATGQIGNDPSTSDTFETIYIPSDDADSKPSAKGDDPDDADSRPSVRGDDPDDADSKPSVRDNDPNAKKRGFRDKPPGSGSDDPTHGPTPLIRDESPDTRQEEEPKPSAKGDDPNAKKRGFRDKPPGSGSDDPTHGPTPLIRDESPDTRQEEEPKPSAKGDDPNAEKRAARDEQARTENEDQNADRNPDAPQLSEDQNADRNPDAPQLSSDEGDESEE